MSPAARVSRRSSPSPATGHTGGMNDLRLRPRLLRSLINSRLPDDHRPSPPLADLADIPDYVKSYGLLSESVTEVDQKVGEAWAAAVDEWVERILLLVGSSAPDKCGVAIYLLGVTCEECCSRRFLTSYSFWFEKLLSKIQLSSNTDFVRVASCASLTDLFTRLARFSNQKKDAISLARKLIQPALQLLNESCTEAVLDNAVRLLCTLMSFFPASMHSRFDEAEATFVSNIMSAKCNSNMTKKFARCLALLANVKGDEDSWCLMIQKILIEVNNILSDAFQGTENEAKSSEIIKLLVPLGKDPPPPLRGQTMSGKSSEQTKKRLHELLLPRVSALMHCCCIMLTNPYPDQVTVPVRTLLALVWRILAVDGSLSESLLLFTTSMQQELLCSGLPSLHLDSLELLSAIINIDRSLLLPHVVNVVQHLIEYFRRSSMPCIRIKLYSILQTLLISMRAGTPFYLVEEVINNVYADLSDSPASGLTSVGNYSATKDNKLPMKSNHRKRKHAFEQLSNGARLVNDEDSRKSVTPVPVKIAALKALQALLTVSGSLQPERWRSEVDLLLIEVARNACNTGWTDGAKCASIGEELTPKRAEFQLAALEALLASLLSPSHARPPYLSHGVDLFTEGKHHGGTQLAGFCALALLALQVLVRPQSLPLDDFPSARSSAYGDRTLEAPSSSKDVLGSADELFTSSLKDDREPTIDSGKQNQQTNHFEQPEDAAAKQPQHGAVEQPRQSLDRDDDLTEPSEEPKLSTTGAIDPVGVFMDEDPSKSVGAAISSRNDRLPSQSNIVNMDDASNIETDVKEALKSLDTPQCLPTVESLQLTQSIAAYTKNNEVSLQDDSDSDFIFAIEDVDPDSDDADRDSSGGDSESD